MCVVFVLGNLMALVVTVSVCVRVRAGVTGDVTDTVIAIVLPL